jgi:hypothetical protein
MDLPIPSADFVCHFALVVAIAGVAAAAAVAVAIAVVAASIILAVHPVPTGNSLTVDARASPEVYAVVQTSPAAVL